RLTLALNEKGEIIWHKCLDYTYGIYRVGENKLFIWPKYFAECVPPEKRKPGIYALDLLTGKDLWFYETTSEPMPFAFADGKLFFAERYRNPAGNLVWRIVALNAENGAKVWERDLPYELEGVYYADKEILLYYPFGGKLSAMRTLDGKPLEVGDNPGRDKTIAIWEHRLYLFKIGMIELFIGNN
ncbi:MAG: PQQ-like beta-propeller repeat protein, partial [Archaeoglobaceae archaeon]|nr:PQQ-like beta-propeller repeat protein [Archaeoglobaceae archaeon]MDW8118142.1 hypothetical protein [Archaeoglobaceae archaeon]